MFISCLLYILLNKLFLHLFISLHTGVGSQGMCVCLWGYHSEGDGGCFSVRAWVDGWVGRMERGMLSLKVQETFRVQFDLGFKGAIRCPGLLGSV